MAGSLLAALLLLSTPDVAETAEPMEEPVAGEAAAPVEDDVICRRKIRSGGKIGERSTSAEVCKTREEWENGRRKRR